MPRDRLRQAYRLRWGWREQAIWRAFRVAVAAVVRVAPPQVGEWPHARVARQRSAPQAQARPGYVTGGPVTRAPGGSPVARAGGCHTWTVSSPRW
jgi:hypothetical protein